MHPTRVLVTFLLLTVVNKLSTVVSIAYLVNSSVRH